MASPNTPVKYVGNRTFAHGHTMDIWENMPLVRSSTNAMCVARSSTMLAICVSTCSYTQVQLHVKYITCMYFYLLVSLQVRNLVWQIFQINNRFCRTHVHVPSLLSAESSLDFFNLLFNIKLLLLHVQHSIQRIWKWAICDHFWSLVFFLMPHRKYSRCIVIYNLLSHSRIRIIVIIVIFFYFILF